MCDAKKRNDIEADEAQQINDANKNLDAHKRMHWNLDRSTKRFKGMGATSDRNEMNRKKQKKSARVHNNQRMKNCIDQRVEYKHSRFIRLHLKV